MQSASAEIGPTAYRVLEVISPPLPGLGRCGNIDVGGDEQEAMVGPDHDPPISGPVEHSYRPGEVGDQFLEQLGSDIGGDLAAVIDVPGHKHHRLSARCPLSKLVL